MAAAMASVARPMSETRLTARCTIYCDWLVSLIIATGVVFAWRGAWNICDALLLPEQPLWSAAARLIGGSVLFVVACVIQPSLAAWARHHDRTRCLWLVDALYTYLSFWVSVLTWNGVWYIYDQVVGIGLAPARPTGRTRGRARLATCSGCCCSGRSARCATASPRRWSSPRTPSRRSLARVSRRAWALGSTRLRG